jgi:hypothetical protein
VNAVELIRVKRLVLPLHDAADKESRDARTLATFRPPARLRLACQELLEELEAVLKLCGPKP